MCYHFDQHHWHHHRHHHHHHRHRRRHHGLHEPCKNGWTDQDAVSGTGWRGRKEPFVRWGAH